MRFHLAPKKGFEVSIVSGIPINYVTFRNHMSAITSITYHQRKMETAGHSDSRVYRLISNANRTE